VGERAIIKILTAKKLLFHGMSAHVQERGEQQQEEQPQQEQQQQQQQQHQEQHKNDKNKDNNNNHIKFSAITNN
jgi:hypothetical protein